MKKIGLLLTGITLILSVASAVQPPFIEDLLVLSMDRAQKTLILYVASSGCTQKADFAFEMKDGVLTVLRKNRDDCKAMPSRIELRFSFQEAGIDPNKPFKIANKFVANENLANIRKSAPAALAADEQEKQITGVLHLDKLIPFRLEADGPLFVNKGSKSEGSTRDVSLTIPDELQSKAKALEGKRVVVVGKLECSGNWRWVDCRMQVRAIMPAEIDEPSKKLGAG